MQYKYPIVAELVSSLEHRRDGYVQFWEQFRDACGNDADMRQRIDDFFVDIINQVELQIEKLQTTFSDF